MVRRQKCPACNRDGAIESREQKLRGVLVTTYGFECAVCGYQVQNKTTMDELVERMKDDKDKIDALSGKSRPPG